MEASIPGRLRISAAGCMRTYSRRRPVRAIHAATPSPRSRRRGGQTRPEALRLEALIKRLTREEKLRLIAAPETVAAVFGEKLRGAQYAPLPPEELHL